MNFLKSAIIFSLLALFVIACNRTTTPDVANTNTEAKPANTANEPSGAPDEMASGRKNYKEQCARCHKDDGTGGEVEIEGRKIKPDNLTSDKMKKEPDSEYMKVMVKGISDEGMPSFKDVLKEEEMNEVIKYIRSELQK